MGFFSKRVDKQLQAYQQELIETHYREVDNMYKQIRGWRHDYRNHIQVMKAYAQSGNLDAIREYLDKLDQDLTTVDTVIKTGNAMTDAILNSKISLAKSKGIQVVADAHIPVKLKSSEIDLCCIIGNLFDNAIEASLPLPEDKRLIRVYMDMKNTQLYISFTNFTAGKKLPKLGGRFRTTKGEGHGFGLQRIDAIVERLEGYIMTLKRNALPVCDELIAKGDFLSHSGYSIVKQAIANGLEFDAVQASNDQAAIGAIKREMNNAKWTWFAIGYQCGFAYLIALMINQFGNAFTGSLNVIGLIAAIAALALIIYMLFKPYKEATKLSDKH